VLPALRRGLLTAIPVGVAVLLDLGFETRVAGAVATGALLAGFVAFDAPARTRAQWQLMAAPVTGVCAAIGVLSSHSAILAVAVMTVVATAAGFCVAVSPRLALAAMMSVLVLLIAQGLHLSAHDATLALLLAVAGGLLQAAVSLVASLSDKAQEQLRLREGLRDARDACTQALTLESHAFRHALRWGVALGVGVAVYRFIDLQGHGYWVPLTIVFVLRPEADDTRERLAMRAAGTFAGLALATAIAEIFGYHVVPTAIMLTAAATFSYSLLRIEYALFTMAITVFVVLLSDALGEHALKAAGQRGLATAIGIALAALAITVWPNAPATATSEDLGARSPGT
jgi:Fusaric acid resistance protein-like